MAWLEAICAARFDLERGQLVDCCLPEGVLNPQEESTVAFSAFPDSSVQHHSASSSSSSVHDSVFFFRIRRKDAQRFLYGYVFNRQRHDRRLPRSSEQKSVVVLSEHPYSCVFKQLVQIAGPLFFDIGKLALEKVTACVSSWPAPQHGCVMELPVLGSTIRARLPESPFDMPSGPSTHSMFHEVDLFGVFRGILMHLWLLWELVLVGQPLLVLASSPCRSSDAVAALISLVSPLPCNLDFRPYFTIHDPDVADLPGLGAGAIVERKERELPMLLGVTNLLFLRLLKGFPHVLLLGTGQQQQQNRRFPLLKVLAGKEGPLTGHRREGLWTSYAAVTKPDTSVLNRLVDPPSSPELDESVAVVNNELLKRHFLELTTNFLAPFGPYLQAAPPGDTAPPFAEPPPLPPFDPQHFLDALVARGPGKFLANRFRRNWTDLYMHFISGPNFMPWFQRRRALAEDEQKRLWRQKPDMHSLWPSMTEVERIDAFHSIASHLQAALAEPESEKLQTNLRLVFDSLPKDMQQLLLLNPAYVALLGSEPHF